MDCQLRTKSPKERQTNDKREKLEREKNREIIKLIKTEKLPFLAESFPNCLLVYIGTLLL